MIGFLSKLFGGNKSDKDVKRIQPLVARINTAYAALQPLSHDQLRNKTQDFRKRIHEHLADIDKQIAAKKAEADGQVDADLNNREAIYEEVDKLVKTRDEKIEEVLEE